MLFIRIFVMEHFRILNTNSFIKRNSVGSQYLLTFARLGIFWGKFGFIDDWGF